ncbi:hypothetical protein [Pseudomonas sp. Marseille-QA0892]
MTSAHTHAEQRPHPVLSSVGDLLCSVAGAAFVGAVPVAGLLWWYGAYPFTQTFFVPALLVVALAVAAIHTYMRSSRHGGQVVPPLICATMAACFGCALAYGMATQPLSSVTLAEASQFGPAPGLLPAGRYGSPYAPTATYQTACIAAAHRPTGASPAGGLQPVSISATVSPNCAAGAVRAGDRVEAGLR